MSLASFYFVSTKQISMVSLVLLCLFSTTFCWPSRSSQVEARSFPLDSQSDDNMMARNFKEYLMRRLMEDYSSGSDRNSMAQRAPLTGSTMRPGVKRSCKIDGGMTFNCDFKQLMEASKLQRYYNSPASPGRRKRFQSIESSPAFDMNSKFITALIDHNSSPLTEDGDESSR
ncbi:uncharacterized protein LOC141855264 isoform X1 [Brevipalpus obovatus]|uniref:uncharacterized protein LOC141855264 isoform X1 n=1 Tax=Brevipalpus obovatus TaxID=246614 RepID=UPI003D9E9F72